MPGDPTTKNPSRQRHPDGTHPDRDRDPQPWHRLRWPDRRPDDDPDEENDLGAHATVPPWDWDPDD